MPNAPPIMENGYYWIMKYRITPRSLALPTQRRCCTPHRRARITDGVVANSTGMR